MAFLKSAKETLAVDGEGPDLPFVENGYLYLASAAGADALRANHATQSAEGADVALLSPEQVSARFPFLDTDGVALASLGLSGEGWFDAYSLDAGVPPQSGLARRNLRAGRSRRSRARRRAGDGGAAKGTRPHRLRRLRQRRRRLGRGAAGAQAWASRFPWNSRKRCVFAFEARRQSDRFPLLIDPSGVYVRPEGRLYLIGGPPPDPDPDTQDFEVDWPQFEESLWPTLAARIPAFEELKLVRAWAGHYDLNVFDHNAIVGRLPGFDNAYLAAGFSGHGVQQSPAVGRGLAELIVHGAYRTLDLTDFGFDRIVAGRPLIERNVI